MRGKHSEREGEPEKQHGVAGGDRLTRAVGVKGVRSRDTACEDLRDHPVQAHLQGSQRPPQVRKQSKGIPRISWFYPFEIKKYRPLKDEVK